MLFSKKKQPNVQEADLFIQSSKSKGKCWETHSSKLADLIFHTWASDDVFQLAAIYWTKQNPRTSDSRFP